ncbi:hypothetical protein PWT90_04738 [Aphanocladium album]|nr:hypothetical protein PWT90_04738 [Aphanocladium album]
MDFIKKAAGELNKGSSSNNEQSQQQNQGGDNQNQQGGDNNQQQSTNSNDPGKEDYLDKGIGFVSKKAGYNISRENEEKVGDGLRNAYEKYSGSKVPEKFSN